MIEELKGMSVGADRPDIELAKNALAGELGRLNDSLAPAGGGEGQGEEVSGPAQEFRVEIRIAPRAGLLDPEGKAIQHALDSLDFNGVRDVRVGRLLRLALGADTPQAARAAADAMCRKLLANPVTEDYEIEVLPERGGRG